jgi:hypothetical protein
LTAGFDSRVDLAAVRTLLSIRGVLAVRALAAEGFDSRAVDFATVRGLLSVRGVLAVRALADAFGSTLLFVETLRLVATFLFVEALLFGETLLALVRFEADPLAATTPELLNAPGFGVAATGGCPWLTATN